MISTIIWRQDDHFDPNLQFCPEKCTTFDVARITNNFLRNERLVSAMSPKRAWEIRSIEMFFTILLKIPEMPVNARKIELLDFEVGLGSAVHHLK